MTIFWACPCHHSPPIQDKISKFGPKMHLSTVKIQCANLYGKYRTITELKGHEVYMICKENCLFSPRALASRIPARVDFAQENWYWSIYKIVTLLLMSYFLHSSTYSNRSDPELIKTLHISPLQMAQEACIVCNFFLENCPWWDGFLLL